MTDAPSPYELHRQANGDTAEYLRLMEAHGHLVPRRPDRCKTCGISKQQILGKHNELVELVKAAAPFVNAVAVLADDKGPALGWIAQAADALHLDLAASGDHETPAEGHNHAPRGER